MLNQSSSPTVLEDALGDPISGGAPGALFGLVMPTPQATAPLDVFDDDTAVEWSEEDVVFLHWRLLQEIGDLRDAETPLEEKFDTLRWVFTDRDKESRPFSFVNCLKVVTPKRFGTPNSPN